MSPPSVERRPSNAAWAMPVVLRIERPPAARTPLLEAAAAAALALCLDPRAEPGGEWHEAVTAWVDARIRKIARRARGAHWAAVEQLPGITWTVGAAQTRALVPGPVDDVAREVARLQIGGTELEPDDPAPPPAGMPVIWVNAALRMTVGKAAAQVGHAAMLYAAAHGLTTVPAFAVRDAEPDLWVHLMAQDSVVAVRDGGFTEVAPGTVTCAVSTGRAGLSYEPSGRESRSSGYVSP